MKLLLVFATGLLGLTSCATTRTVGSDNNVVTMKSHTLTVPPDRGWLLKELPGPQHTYLQFEDGEVIYRAGVFYRAVDDPKLQAYTADELAALYFRNEQKRVLKADGGKYTIEDATIGTEELGGQRFHTLAYRTTAEGFEAETFLFLRIPFEANNKALVAIEFRQAPPTGPPWAPDPSRLEDVRAVAASLRLDEPSFRP